MANKHPDSNDHAYWRGFSQQDLDIMIDGIRDNPTFQVYLSSKGLDIRKFGDTAHKEAHFESTIRRVVREELQKVLNA